MTYIMRVLALEGQVTVSDTQGYEGVWITDYDPDAHDGQGEASFTRDVSQAKRFESFEDAWAYWRQPSRTHPLRDDGKPNRPLTAFTVSFENPDKRGGDSVGTDRTDRAKAH